MDEEMIRHVPQEDRMGCVIASLAMVLGLTYQETLKRFNAEGTKGYSFYWWMEALSQSGWSYQMLWKTDQLTGYNRAEWPPKPWAPLHLCQVHTPQGAHMVVMKEDGIVYDPAFPHPLDPYRLDITRYEYVDYVAGLFPVK
jgi:hypothetical protein